MRILNYIMAALTAATLFYGCNDDIDWSTDPSIRLCYSTDSLKFEPLVTEQLTSTRLVKIKNNSSEDLRIESIKLYSQGNNFQMNVDGRNGTEIYDIQLRSKDSCYIFVRANLSKQDENQPVVINDSIVISYNGNTDHIVLNAIGQNAVVLRNKTIEADTTWTNAQPILIFDSLKVKEGVTLTIKPGTKLLLHHGATITVDGKLDVMGNASNMVQMSGDRFDEIVTDVPYSRLANQWGGLRFSASSTCNILEGLYMTGSTFGIVVDSAEIDDSAWRLTIANSEIRVSTNGTLQANNARIKAYNSVFANGGTSNVALRGGDYLFNFCTISNYSSSTRILNSLFLSGSETQPITAANFNNCIINGNSFNEIKAEGEDFCQYHIDHCFVKETSNDTIHFSNCVHEKGNEVGFTLINKEYFYDFHIDSTSKARNIGDSTLVVRFPECATDLDANPRDNGGKPDVGAYTYIKKENATKRKR